MDWESPFIHLYKIVAIVEELNAMVVAGKRAADDSRELLARIDVLLASASLSPHRE